MADNAGKKKGTVKLVAGALAILILAVLALPFLLDVNQFRPQIESQLTQTLGRKVRLGSIKLSILSGNLSVRDIVIEDNPVFGASPFITAKSLQIGVELRPLIFSKEIRITDITLEQPAIQLIHASDGKWNFSDLGSAAPKDAETAKGADAAAPADILIRQLQIADGKITIVDGPSPTIYDKVQLEVRNLSARTSFPFTLTAAMPGEGFLKLAGEAGPLGATDMLLTPYQAELTVDHFDLVKSGSVAANSGLSGLFDFKGTIASDGRKVQSRGTATGENLQVVKGGYPASKPVSLDYAVHYDLLGRKGSLQDAGFGFGKARARLNGSFEDRSGKLYLKMSLQGADMPVEDMKDLLPAFGIVLPKGASLQGGSLRADLTAEGFLDKLVTAGTAEILQTRLMGFDLSGKMALVAQLAGLKSSQMTRIEKFAASMRMAPEGIRVGSLQLVMPDLGTLSGAGTISPKQALDFTMQAMLQPAGGIGAGLTALSGKRSLNVPFFVRGTASDPKFVPDAKNAARSILGSALGGSRTTDGQTGSSIGDSLRGLFQKKQ